MQTRVPLVPCKFHVVVLVYHCLFTLVLKSPNGEWPITCTFFTFSIQWWASLYWTTYSITLEPRWYCQCLVLVKCLHGNSPAYIWDFLIYDGCDLRGMELLYTNMIITLNGWKNSLTWGPFVFMNWPRHWWNVARRSYAIWIWEWGRKSTEAG